MEATHQNCTATQIIEDAKDDLYRAIEVLTDATISLTCDSLQPKTVTRRAINAAVAGLQGVDLALGDALDKLGA